jgi:hypothetical protein
VGGRDGNADLLCQKQPRNDTHKQIENVGGSGWMMTQAQTTEEIENGAEYEASVGGQTVAVVIAEHDGNKYILTDPDQTTENNLLSPSECP